MKLGSLFDGSGGFPLAGLMCGIEPVWASEVEPYPIAVTTSRFKNIKHLGDISKINGAEIEPVDIITFGSPCQDLSVAGKRAGIKHSANGDDETTRSGLFMEAIRIIKEMRVATNGVYPTYALWENVPGAFSSNKGEDFRIVLEEFVRIKEPTAVMPEVPKGGWAYADCISGNGFSIAYRTFDAQYWGVPQRRRRIHLVADFRGRSAKKVLFECDSLQGDIATSRKTWEEITTGFGNGFKSNDIERKGITLSNVASTLRAGAGAPKHEQDYIGRLIVEETNIFAIDRATFNCGQGFARELGITNDGINSTLVSKGPSAVCYATTYDARGNGNGSVVNTLTGEHNNRITDYSSVVCLQGNGIDRADTAGCNGKGWNDEVCYTLNTIYKHAVAYGIDHAITTGGNCTAQGACVYKDIQATLKASGVHAVAYGINGNKVSTLMAHPKYSSSKAPFFTSAEEELANTLVATDYKDPPIVNDEVGTDYIVRRLTPTECARLQGFPDWWGWLYEKEDMTDTEYKFWLEVRNTHAAINDKTVKNYTKPQMVKWYNKLWNDSAEYKMWGNGIALPPAYYCMQGMAETLMERGG